MNRLKDEDKILIDAIRTIGRAEDKKELEFAHIATEIVFGNKSVDTGKIIPAQDYSSSCIRKRDAIERGLQRRFYEIRKKELPDDEETILLNELREKLIKIKDNAGTLDEVVKLLEESGLVKIKQRKSYGPLTLLPEDKLK